MNIERENGEEFTKIFETYNYAEIIKKIFILDYQFSFIFFGEKVEGILIMKLINYIKANVYYDVRGKYLLKLS